MGNIDFGNEPMFSWYCVMLVVSGFMLVGASFVPKLTVALKAVSLLGGLACLGYAYYLIYAFHGGTYYISFKLFLLPIFLIGAAIRALLERRDAKKAPLLRAAQEQKWAAESAWHAQRQPQPGQPAQPAPSQSLQAQAAQTQAEWAQSPWAVPSAERPAPTPPTPAP